MKKIFLFVFVLFVFVNAKAQELRFEISISTPKLQTVDPKVFDTMKSTLENFLNNQQWTDHVYEQDERIDCKVQLTITEEVSPTSFKAELFIQSKRPIYGSTYQSVLLSHVDKNVSFDYQEYQPLEFTRSNFSNNLTSILSFYVYYILGLDYDSFSPFGGEEYFQLANEILNAVPATVSAIHKGWRAPDSNRNRYWMIENILNPRVRPYRQLWYDYHRQSLDLMEQDPTAGRTIIEKGLIELDKLNRNFPNMMIMQMFANAKSGEIVEIFKGGTKDEKKNVIQVMSRIDVANASRYRAIGR